MVQRWAMLRDGVVENVCNWDGLLTTWHPPEGIVMKEAPDHVGIGWSHDGVDWVAPPEIPQ